MGRTGTLHAWGQEGVVPDIQTIGKALGGGYQPIAGLLANHRVIGAIGQGTSYVSIPWQMLALADQKSQFLRPRPHLPGPPSRLRRRPRGPTYHQGELTASERPDPGRETLRWVEEGIVRPSQRRQHQGSRILLGYRVRRRQREFDSVPRGGPRGHGYFRARVEGAVRDQCVSWGRHRRWGERGPHHRFPAVQCYRG